MTQPDKLVPAFPVTSVTVERHKHLSEEINDAASRKQLGLAVCSYSTNGPP